MPTAHALPNTANNHSGGSKLKSAITNILSDGSKIPIHIAEP